jgi:hypothetical protein
MAPVTDQDLAWLTIAARPARLPARPLGGVYGVYGGGVGGDGGGVYGGGGGGGGGGYGYGGDGGDYGGYGSGGYGYGGGDYGGGDGGGYGDGYGGDIVLLDLGDGVVLHGPDDAHRYLETQRMLTEWGVESIDQAIAAERLASVRGSALTGASEELR